ncbi:uncharacterized protein EDB91DRAFT_1041445, partial [Suillus paluster]|uniref:uncharacterized protein n=1 Tax=Suillus paluster TaxID=48578 RepID=UPI001B882ED0
RKLNAWNVFVRQKLNEANEELTTGERWKLPTFIAAHQAELMGGYCQLSEAAKNDLRRDINVFHESRVKIVHLNPKALQKQVNAIFHSMEKEVSTGWTNITSCTGVEGFYVAVCGHIEHFHEAKIFCTPKAQSFVKEVLNLDPKCFTLKFESWAIRDFGVWSYNHLSPMKLISMCHRSIQKGLNEIVQKHKLSWKKIKMNYDNYEQKIVETYRIELDGWTYKMLQNPGKIG